MLILTVLAAAAGATWLHLVQKEQKATHQTVCPISTAASAPQFVESYATVGSSVPIPPGAVQVVVLNATDRRGLASQVAGALRLYGFSLAMALGNDRLHPPGTMTCIGQIRFGPNAVRAAHTLSVALPCAQLVRDQRQDTTVDLVLGSEFSTVDPNSAGRTVLKQLEAEGQAPPDGGLQSIAGPGAPAAEKSLLAAAHEQTC